MNAQSELEIAENPPLSNAKLAILILLGSETMLFSGLIGAFLVFRMGSETWPPLSHADIELPRILTGINTGLLIFSGFTMFHALRAIQRNKIILFLLLLISTGVSGLFFLTIQGHEWFQLIKKGLTLQSGVYGAIFYVLIGCHAVHVLGAVIWLAIVTGMAISGRFSSDSHVGVETCTIYWIYVVALWPILYFLVYIA